MKSCLPLIFFVLLVQQVTSQNKILRTGIRVQKTHNLYYENGVSFDYSQDKYLKNKLFIGLSYTTSRLGTAYNSNAIKQDNYTLSIAKYMRQEKIISPYVQINTGYFHSDYEYSIFDALPNSSMLLSLEPGILLNFEYPIKAKFSFGYNVITGDGVDGPGTLLPLYFQLGVYYQFQLKSNGDE